MKKLKSFLMVLLIMLSGIIFSACRDDYNKLGMQFNLGEREVESITLYIDDQGGKDSARLNVSFSGIDEDKIGSISVYTQQAGFVSITDTVLDGSNYYFTLTAKNPTPRSGIDLIVSHLASEKTESIKLFVEKKSSGVETTSNIFVVGKPVSGSGTNRCIIDASKLVSLVPADSTDDIYFKLVNRNQLVAGLETITERVNGEELIKGFACKSSVLDGAYVDLMPVTTMNGYDNTTHNAPEQIVRVLFKNLLTESDLYISAGSAYSNPEVKASINEQIATNTPIVLLHNDPFHTADLVQVKVDLNVGTLLQYFEHEKGVNPNGKAVYKPDLVCEYDETALSVVALGNYEYNIVANKFSAQPLEVKFKIVPANGFVGEVKPITLTLKVINQTRSTDIDVYNQGELQTSNEVSLYNYYSSNPAGARFNFKLVPSAVIDDFSKMRILVNTNMLNVSSRVNGYNPVYTNSKFDTLSASTYASLGASLNFTFNGEPLKFYEDRGMFVSESFTESDSIYIKYEGISGTALKMTVESYYSGNLEYLKTATHTQKVINFNSQEGVNSFDFIVCEKVGGGFTNYDNARSVVYLDKDGQTVNGFRIYNVEGINGYIESTFFTITLFNANNQQLVAGNDYLTIQSQSGGNLGLPYSYLYERGIYPICLFVPKKVGSYTLRVSHPSGISKDILIVVYEKLTAEDINIVGLDEDFANTGFAGYTSNYIVPEGVSLTLNLNFKPGYETNNGFIKSVSYTQVYGDRTNSVSSSENYLTILPITNSSAKLTFNRASYDEGNKYIYVLIEVLTQKYNQALIVQDAEEKVVVEYSFFVYKPISEANMLLSADLQRFAKNQLSQPLVEENLYIANLNLTFVDEQGNALPELGNYVQAQLQDYEKLEQAPAEGESYSAQQMFKSIWQTTNGLDASILGCTYKLKKQAGVLTQSDYGIQIEFLTLGEDLDKYTYSFRVVLSQFGVNYYKGVSITVNKPIISESLIVDNTLYTDDLGYYANIEAGASEPLVLTTHNISSVSENVSNPGVVAYFAFKNGLVYTITQTSTNGQLRLETVGNTVSVYANANATETNVKLIIFAKDVLNESENFLNGKTTTFTQGAMDFYCISNKNGVKYKAYAVLDLLISTGSSTNPYLLTKTSDLSKLNGAEVGKYYQVMNNLNLSGYTTSVANCSANIKTLNNNQYLFEGLTLNDSFKNLFVNFHGVMENISFGVDYRYHNAAGELGVFDVNHGTLENVAVQLIGVCSVKSKTGEPDANFGGLVGSNFGNIVYNKDITAVSGSLTITSGSVYFGGLVGYNGGTVCGYRVSGASALSAVPASVGELTVVFENNTNSGYTANVNITAQAVEDNSAIGALVGRNVAYSKDAIKNISTTGKIKAKNNVGGVVGFNDIAQAQKIGIKFNNLGMVPFSVDEMKTQIKAVFSNITSSVIIQAKDYVGGVVGKDINGSYADCKYQIYDYSLRETDKAIEGEQFVGGIAGSTNNGLFKYCSVASYRLDYVAMFGTENPIISTNVVDVYGTDYVGGIVGYANSSTKSILQKFEPVYVIENNQAVTVYACSTNASISSTGKLGSLLCFEKTSGIIVASHYYFMGVLNGNYYNEVPLTNEVLDNSSEYYPDFLFDRAYVVNYQSGSVSVYKNYSNFGIKTGQNPVNDAPWSYDASINAGYIHLINESGARIMELAPTNMTATIKSAENLAGFNTYEPRIERLSNTTIKIKYYLFNLDQTQADYAIKMQYLNNYFNTYNILDLVDFAVDPSAIDTLRLFVQVSGSAVEVSAGKIIVREVGSADITFISALNSNITASIRIITELPTGNGFEIKSSAIATESADVISIQKNRSKLMYLNFMGSAVYRGNVSVLRNCSFNYLANADVKLLLQLENANELQANNIEGLSIQGAQFVQATNYVLADEFDGVSPYYIYNDGKFEPAGTITQTEFEENGFYYLQAEKLYAIIDPYLYLTAKDFGSQFNLNVYPIVITDQKLAIDVGINDEKNKIILGEQAYYFNYMDVKESGYYRIVSSSLTIQTTTGPSAVSLSQQSAVVYPDYVYPLKVFVDSENNLTSDVNAVLNWFNKEGNFGYFELFEVVDGQHIKLNDVQKYFNLVFVGTNYENGKQSLTFALTFKEVEELTRIKLEFNVYGAQEDEILTTQTIYNILPQKADDISVRNYVYLKGDEEGDKEESNKVQEINTIQPDSNGLIIIDMLPKTGYYDYLEIRDITGSQQIIFAQIDGIGGRTLENFNTKTQDGLGIVLEKQSTTNTIYVSTLLPASASAITHRIEVRAYLEDGTLIIPPKVIEVRVHLMPTVNITYYLPSNKIGFSTSKDMSTPQALAIGTDAILYISTANSNGGLNAPVLESEVGSIADFYKLETMGIDGYYKLKYVGTNITDAYNNLNDKQISITASTTSTMFNGVVETGSTKFLFKFTNYVIHNISLTSTRAVASGEELYGNFNQERNFEFYFETTDISWYGNRNYDNAYRYTDAKAEKTDWTASFDDNIEKLIYGLVKDINSISGSNYINFTNTIQSDWQTDNKNKTYSNSKAGVLINYETHKIIISKPEMNLSSLIVSLGDGINTSLSNNQKTLSIRFATASSMFEPNVIKNENDFITMAMGEDVNYILAKNLTLSNYTPMSLDVNTFDGNGHTITITSFAPFTEPDVQAGLFTTISANSVLMNLQVEYKFTSPGNISASSLAGQEGFKVDTYTDICAENYVFTSGAVGGIAVKNEGVITNCRVVGELAINTPAIATSGDSIPFTVGGLVNTNASTGYITNSVSELAIATFGNIGGFVYSNLGKIASSYFNARNKSDGMRGLIYSYYSNTVSSVVKVNVGGFAVSNNGDIDMCYVDVGTSTSTSNGNIVGNITAKDETGGFIYSNSKNITNCYIVMDRIGQNSNEFSGFAYSNSGNVDRCYAYVSQGKATYSSNLFARPGTAGIMNSYVIVANTETSLPTIKGLDVIRHSRSTMAESYPTFTFGNNTSAVWRITTGMPTLVSTNEINLSAFEIYKNIQPKQSENITVYEGLNKITTTLYVENGAFVYKDVIDYSSLGSSRNPIAIYNTESWGAYFTEQNDNSYYRLVKDIDFYKTTPSTTALTFRGNIQGNGMKISNILLYTQESLETIGLFAKLESDVSVVNAIRNINFVNADIRAVQTAAVGTLAGIATGFDMYNITLNSSATILGNNLIGGLVGLMRGAFDIENITSNISVNSSYSTTLSGYNAYVSFNNGGFNGNLTGNNLKDISYAGSVFGVLDGYGSMLDDTQYFYMRDVNIAGEISAVGETVGAVVGLVGEKTYLKNVEAKLTDGKLSGFQYSGGVVGENRGIIDNANITCARSGSAGLFTNAYTTAAGLVGFNFGGLVMNSTANVNIFKPDTFGNTAIVAGLIGRNVAGSVYNCNYSGEVKVANRLTLEITSGLVGTMYSYKDIVAQNGGLNVINSSVKQKLIKQNDATFYFDKNGNLCNQEVEDGFSLTNDIKNCTISTKTIAYMLNNISDFYVFYESSSKNYEYDESISIRRVLALAVGLYTENASNWTQQLRYGIKNDKFVVNGNVDIDAVAKFDCRTFGGDKGVKIITPYINAVSINQIVNAEGLSDEQKDYIQDTNFVCYIAGSKVGSVDSWDRSSLNGEKVIFTDFESNINSADKFPFYATYTKEEAEDKIQYGLIYANGNSFRFNDYFVGSIEDGEYEKSSVELKLDISSIYVSGKTQYKIEDITATEEGSFANVDRDTFKFDSLDDLKNKKLTIKVEQAGEETTYAYTIYTFMYLNI